MIDGRLYFWQQPGFSYGYLSSIRSIFWNAKQYEHTICDPTLCIGESRMAAGGERSICYRASDKVCETPAGRFENCSVYVYRNNDPYAVSFCETWFCPGVGIVRQLVDRNGERTEWVLSSYTIKGGEGLLPLATDNSWNYVLAEEYPYQHKEENCFVVTSYENGTAVMSADIIAWVLT